MPQLEDNHIDNLFQEAAANAEFAYDPGLWASMEKKLGTVGNNGFVLKVSSIALIMALIGGLTYYGLQTGKNPSMTENSNHFVDQSEVVTNLPQKSTSIAEIAASDEQLIGEIPVDQRVLSNENQSKSNVSNIDSHFLDDVINASNNPIRNSEVAKMAPVKSVNNIGSLKSRLAYLPNSSFHILAHDQLELVDIKKPKNKIGNRFALGFSFAPDYSGVEFNGNKAGYGLGLSLGYSLSNRFTVGIGVLYAKKRYDVVAKQYSSFSGAWANIQKPERIEADCDVIEIPINLRYYLTTNSRGKIFLSSGLSTYLMKAEDYQMRYSTWTGEMSVRNESNHFLSIFNLSIGIEKQITDRFGIEVEPYLRFPLTGIGIGEVNLTSSGTFVTGKYYFGR